MPQILKLYGPRDLRYEEHEILEPEPDEVHVRTRLGAISSGTESAWYFGTDPQLAPTFRPGRVEAAKFPRTLGYEKVAEVVRLGSAVDLLSVGQRVACYYGHAEEYVVPAARAIPVPDDIDDVQAVAASLGTVAAHAIRRARLQVGDDVFVAGLGFVGLLTVAIARTAGAGLLVGSDPIAPRREIALQIGADHVFDPSDGHLVDAVRHRFGGEPFDVAFETSSSYEALADALQVLRRNGRACVVSQLKGPYPTQPVFAIDFHLGELEMISSDGRGDVHKLSRWFFDALRRGSIPDIEPLISHRIAFREIERGFRLIESRPDEVVKILVTYD